MTCGLVGVNIQRKQQQRFRGTELPVCKNTLQTLQQIILNWDGWRILFLLLTTLISWLAHLHKIGGKKTKHNHIYDPMQKSCTQVPFLKLNSFPWKTPLSCSNACVYLVGKVPITVTATMNAIYIHCFNTRKETYPSPDICPLRELTKFQLINLIWSQFNSAWPKISAYCSKTCNHLTVYCNRWLSGLVLSIRAHSDEDKRTARILYEK